MITLKEYAKRKNITYEAVRSQVNRYRELLGDHIIQDGRQQFLDEYAVAFLDERRQKNPVVVYQQSKDEAIEQLRTDLEEANKTINTLLQFKIAVLENQRAIEDAKTAQERRERELDEREDRIAQEISDAAQKAAEDARKAVEAQHAQELADVQQRAQDELTAVQEDYRQAEAALEKMRDEATMRLQEAEAAEQREQEAEKAHREELAERDRRIQELENRTFGDYLRGLFRKKGKE